MAKNRCDCADPPGGSVTCGANQLAICKVKDGKPDAHCEDPPTGDDVPSGGILAWCLAQISGDASLADLPLDQAGLDILNAGAYVDPATGVTVRFSLPEDLHLPGPGGGSGPGQAGGGPRAQARPTPYWPPRAKSA